MIQSPPLKSRLAVVAAVVLAALAGPATSVSAATPSEVGSSWSGSSSSRSSITLSRPAEAVAGDVMVASIVSNDDEPGFAAPAGWSLVRDDAVTDAVRQAVYVKVAGPSEPSSYTWTLPGWRRVAGGITTYSGVDTTHPVDAHAASTHPGGGTAVTAPSVTTSVPDTMLVHLAAVNAEGNVSPPAGMTQRWEADSPNSKSSRDALAAVSDGPQPAAGPTGPRTATATSPGPRIGALLALRPADTTPPPDDSDPPDTTIDSGPTGTVTDSTASFAFSADEPATFACALDGNTPTLCTSPTTYTSLANGPHTFAVTATDTAGNPDPTAATRTWTVDADAPAEDVIETVAGTGTAGFSGDGGPATAARLAQPRTMAADAGGNIYVVDSENHRVRRIDANTGVITTIGGTGTAGFSGDGGPATAARLDTPHGIAVDNAGNVYVADPPNQRIRRIAPDGVITTVAGTGAPGYNGDNIPATSARLNYPKGVEIGPDGGLYIGDANNHRVRRVSPSGTITTVAGTGNAGYSGDGGAATAARLHTPRNVAFDGDGNLYIADDENFAVRRVSPSGVITTVAGTGTAGFSGDGGPATAARLRRVRDVAVDAAGTLYIADEQNDRIRVVEPDGTIRTLAGTGTSGSSGDGAVPSETRLRGPRGVAVDPSGRIFIADTGNHRIRRVTRS